MISRPNAEAHYSGVRMALLGDSFESVTHSFVIRIWLEGDDQAHWRGHITHVPSGKRQYVERLGDIVDFIALHVDGMKLGKTSRFKRWWSARKLKQTPDGGDTG